MKVTRTVDLYNSIHTQARRTSILVVFIYIKGIWANGKHTVVIDY